jgi:hypothetical protein
MGQGGEGYGKSSLRPFDEGAGGLPGQQDVALVEVSQPLPGSGGGFRFRLPGIPDPDTVVVYGLQPDIQGAGAANLVVLYGVLDQ